MAVTQDTHIPTYTITEEGYGPLSSPWYLTYTAGFESPEARIDAGQMYFGSDVTLKRQTGLSGNWVMELQAFPSSATPAYEAAAASVDGKISIGLPYVSNFFTNGNSFPGIQWLPSTSGIRRCGFKRGTVPSLVTFGTTWTTTTLTGVYHPSAQIQFIVQPSQQRVAMRITLGATVYSSGWVTWGAAISDYTRPLIMTSTSGYGARIGAITYTDGLTDQQIEDVEETGEVPDGRPAPTHSSIFPEATAKPAYFRILRGDRNIAQAQNFHEMMRERSA